MLKRHGYIIYYDKYRYVHQTYDYWDFEMSRPKWAKMYELWLWILLQYHANLHCVIEHGIHEMVSSWLVENELMIVIIILH